MMMNIIFIAVGGAFGAVLRFYVSDWVQSTLGRDFPYATLAVNMLGSFCIGLLFVLLVTKWNVPVYWRLGLIVGLLGAFTTFSTFSIETLALIEAGEHIKAGVNMISSVLLCIIACWVGLIMARQL